MNLGLIGRSEDRGLGVMMWEAFRHLQPEGTLLIEPVGVAGKGFATHPERYPGATVARWQNERLDESIVRGWLEPLDVAYSAELFYDTRLIGWAREAGVRTVCAVMPEFHRADDPEPDALWNPTSWRLDKLPLRTEVVPVPVALDRFGEREPRTGARFLHVIGHAAMSDRAGTLALIEALAHCRAPMHVTFVTQDRRLPRISRYGRNVRVETRILNKGAYWSLYDGFDVLVAPRRFGGLSLPFNEACAAGLALILPDVGPNRDTWPARFVPALPGPPVSTPAGEVATYDTDPRALAQAMDDLATHPNHVEGLSIASLLWAEGHGWERLRPVYEAAFGRVLSGHGTPSADVGRS